jgi:hypothetical protein
MSVDRPQGLIEGSGQRGEQRRLDQMVSARLDPMLVAAVKEYAQRHGLSVSDVFREAATQLLQREEAQNVVTFRVDVTNETRPGGISRKSYQTDIPMAVLRVSGSGQSCVRCHVPWSLGWTDVNVSEGGGGSPRYGLPVSVGVARAR